MRPGGSGYGPLTEKSRPIIFPGIGRMKTRMAAKCIDQMPTQ
jgi:hypothetical protein